MMFRAVFWVILPCKMFFLHGSTTQKTALNIKLLFFNKKKRKYPDVYVIRDPVYTVHSIDKLYTASQP
jgi:hypothetical protein